MMIDAIKWASDIDQRLAVSAGDDLSEIRADVIAGRADLYRIAGDKTDVHMVARGEGSELVIMCVEGVGMGPVGPVLIDSAKRQGFKTIRYHCKNPAVHRLYQRYGFAGVECERVYKINLGVIGE
jgi:hypothetical protein